MTTIHDSFNEANEVFRTPPTVNGIEYEPTELPDDTILADTEPIEHYNILETSVGMPDQGKKRPGKIQKELTNLYSAIGMGIYPFDNQTGAIIMDSAEPCASSLAELAATNPRIKRAIESVLTTSAWSAVIAAHLPIAVGVATKYVPFIRDNYARVMDNMMGTQTE